MTKSIFDGEAGVYDEIFTFSKIGWLQRRIVWQYLHAHVEITQSTRILELNCGTGIDAQFLAAQKATVLATDASMQMVEIAKARNSSITQNSVQFQQMRIEDIQASKFSAKFDVIFSNFGGLNCLDRKALANLSTVIPLLLNDTGKFIAVLMPRFCLQESLYFLFKGEWSKVFRRAKGQSIWSNSGNQQVKIHYHSPKSFSASFSNGLKEQAVIPVGVFIPPSYTEPFFRKHRYILHFLTQIERKFHYKFAASFADHYLIDLTKTTT